MIIVDLFLFFFFSIFIPCTKRRGFAAKCLGGQMRRPVEKRDNNITIPVAQLCSKANNKNILEPGIVGGKLIRQL